MNLVSGDNYVNLIIINESKSNINYITMKKILLSICALAIFSIASIAQNITVHHQEESNLEVTNDTIKIFVDETGDAEVHLSLFNGTASDITFKATKKIIDTVTNSMNDFCWGMCYSPSVMVSTASLIVNHDEYSAQGNLGFYAHYHANGTFGTSILDYSFFDVDNEEVEYKTTVKWIHEANGINDKELVSFSNLYPNPANTKVEFTYNLNNNSNGYVVVTDILGSKVMNVQLNGTSNTQAINTTALKSGAYFCTFVVDDSIVKTSKLIVSH